MTRNYVGNEPNQDIIRQNGGVHSLKELYDREKYGIYGSSLNIASVTWQRPGDWLAMPDMSSPTQNVNCLVAVFNDDNNYVAFSCAGNYTVDWGDGSVENYSSGIKAEHAYDYSSISAATESVRGYRQVIIQIYPQSGQNLTTVNLQQNHSYYISDGVNLSGGNSILEIDMYVPNCTSLTLSGGAVNSGLLRMVEKITIRDTAVTSMSFAGLTSLLSVNLYPEATSSITSFASMFFACYSLLSIETLSGPSVTSCSSMFSGCQSLYNVGTIDLPICTNFSNMFLGCISLTRIDYINMPATRKFLSDMFNGCSSLKYTPNGLRVDPNNVNEDAISGLFDGCKSLKYAPILKTYNVTSTSRMFANCNSLEYVPLYDTSNVTNMTSMFTDCYSLKNVPQFNTAKVTNTWKMFQECRSLIQIPDINLANTTNIGGMFTHCNSVSRIYISAGNLVSTGLIDTFRGCESLIDLNLGNTGLGPVTDMTSSFSFCRSLKNIELTTLRAVTTLSNTFLNCESLETVVLSNTANVTNMANTFNSCSALERVDIPNLDRVTNYSDTFRNCFSLKQCNIGNTSILVASAPVVSATFFNCYSLQSININFSRSTTLGTTGAFNSCRSLRYCDIGNTFNITTAFPAATWSGCSVLADLRVGAFRYGGSFSDSISSAGIGYKAAERILMNAAPRVAGTTARNIVFSSGPAMKNTFTKAACSLTNTSTTVAQSNTANILPGMWVTGPGVSTAINTYTDATTDIFSYASHGLIDGDEVGVYQVITTTGIALNTVYQVINSTTDTFQLSNSSGIINMGVGGRANVIYGTSVVSVDPGVGFVMSKPATRTASVTLTIRDLNISLGSLKGYQINGQNPGFTT